MANVNEADPAALIESISGKLKEMDSIKPPVWAAIVKTGAHRERPPHNSDWWYVRCASLLRQVYLRGPIGVGKLRNWYGGKKNRGVKPDKHVAAGGAVIRKGLQQLEKAGLIKTIEKGGRQITPKGQSLLGKTSTEVVPRKEKKPPVAKKPVKKKIAKKIVAKKPEPKIEPKPEIKAPEPKKAEPTPVEQTAKEPIKEEKKDE